VSTWSFVLSSGGDITNLVDISSVVKTRRLHSELKPNSNKCEFRAMFDATLWSALLATEDITATITKDGVTYFYGYVSPNFSTEISQSRKFISLIVEDPTLKLLGKTIASSLVYVGAKVCDPSDTAHSLVHLLCAAAGVTLAGGLPTLSTVVPYVCVLPDDNATYSDILSELLYCYSWVYSFNDDGTLYLYETVNGGTVTTTATLDIVANGGSVRRSLQSKKTPKKYDDLRVRFDSVEFQSDIVLFKDTSGASGSNECTITLNANGDTDGKDYYPTDSGSTEVFSEWKNPDGLTVVAATSVALDTIIGGGIELSRVLTNYTRRASFSYHNTSGYAQIITSLRIKGDAWVKTAENVARSSSAGQLLYEYKAKYIFTQAQAQDLAQRLAQYYAYSSQVYNARSKADIAIGAYVLVSDSVYSGLAQKCRVVGRKYLDYERVSEYDLEAVADYVAVPIVLEATSLSGQAATDYAISQLAQMAEDGIITPQEKGNLALRWQDINGDGISSGSYWQTHASAIEANVPTDAIDNARDVLNGQLFGSPGVLRPELWNQNISIVIATFYNAFAQYYAAESSTVATITRYAGYGFSTQIDCGLWSVSDPDDAPELDAGEYIPTNNQDMSVDYDCADYDAGPGGISLGSGDMHAWLSLTGLSFNGSVYNHLRIYLIKEVASSGNSVLSIAYINGIAGTQGVFYFIPHSVGESFYIDIDISSLLAWQTTINSLMISSNDGYYHASSVMVYSDTSTSKIDCAQYDPSSPDPSGLYDCLTYTPPDGKFILPALIVDCGNI
jgi:hypothetical protein